MSLGPKASALATATGGRHAFFDLHHGLALQLFTALALSRWGI